ncbi:hypothetical protein C8R48DRAFT_337902 [Suillus tomentosus]|nr:hypothetical protein C8R48DRAFT_337902 [Suillus tomentosus]
MEAAFQSWHGTLGQSQFFKPYFQRMKIFDTSRIPHSAYTNTTPLYHADAVSDTYHRPGAMSDI